MKGNVRFDGCAEVADVEDGDYGPIHVQLESVAALACACGASGKSATLAGVKRFFAKHQEHGQ